MQTVEELIQSKGLTAPRINPSDIEDTITGEDTWTQSENSQLLWAVLILVSMGAFCMLAVYGLVELVRHWL